jgi:hypothetical protein
MTPQNSPHARAHWTVVFALHRDLHIPRCGNFPQLLSKVSQKSHFAKIEASPSGNAEGFDYPSHPHMPRSFL